MRAWAVSIGSELLSGQITDTNATFLAQECAGAGIDLIRVTQVGDEMEALVSTLQLALAGADVVICTGGVGPTDDDLTREAIARIAGESPRVDPLLLRELKSFFANRGQEMPARNAKQAWVIPSSETLLNPVGTAPGWIVRLNKGEYRGVVVAMPGVPREMYRMWREQVLPALQPETVAHVIRSVTLKTLGIGESAAEDQIHDLVMRSHPIIATYAKDDGVHIRVTAMGDSLGETQRLLASGIRDVQGTLGKYIWGRDSDTLPTVILHALEQSSSTVAVTEVGSGGAFVGMLTSIPSEDLTHPLIDARVFPLDLSLTSDDAFRRASDIAAQSRVDSQATMGLAIVVSGTLDDRRVLHGQATVAIDAGDTMRDLTHIGLRSSLEDVHRRSALHAVDRLRQLLMVQSNDSYQESTRD